MIYVNIAIHIGLIYEEFRQSHEGPVGPVPVAVLVGAPIYSNAAGIIPVVQALMEKGASLGTVLAFMMSVIGISFPEIVILRRVLKPRLIAVFVGVVTVGIMIVGFIFNAIL